MIEYYEQLSQEEKEEITEVVQTLYRQTFLLERKFDKRSGRMQYTKEYRICSKHLEFLKCYFAIAGIQLKENVHMGVIYIQGEMLWGEKLPRLATIYLLVLKLIYDEQMQAVSSSMAQSRCSFSALFTRAAWAPRTANSSALRLSGARSRPRRCSGRPVQARWEAQAESAVTVICLRRRNSTAVPRPVCSMASSRCPVSTAVHPCRPAMVIAVATVRRAARVKPL